MSLPVEGERELSDALLYHLAAQPVRVLDERGDRPVLG